MGQVTVRRMQEEYGCDPADILASVGPSICQDCYEVSEDVIEQFRQNFTDTIWDKSVSYTHLDVYKRQI